MTYFVSLKLVAILVGILVALLHLPAALAPEKTGAFFKALPRNYPLGIVLMLAATIWFVVLTGKMDLGEISNIRIQLMLVWAAAGVLMIIFVPGFLAARAIGCLMLLAASVILDAAFLALTPWRYFMTVLAYAWVICGMILVYSPHYWRDFLQYITHRPKRLATFAWPGVIFGLVILALGIFVYPSNQ